MVAMLAVALILFFFVMPLIVTLITAFIVGKLGAGLGALVIGAAFILTPFGYLFMGLPLIIGFFLGAGWSAIRR